MHNPERNFENITNDKVQTPKFNAQQLQELYTPPGKSSAQDVTPTKGDGKTLDFGTVDSLYGGHGSITAAAGKDGQLTATGSTTGDNSNDKNLRVSNISPGDGQNKAQTAQEQPGKPGDWQNAQPNPPGDKQKSPGDKQSPPQQSPPGDQQSPPQQTPSGDQQSPPSDQSGNPGAHKGKHHKHHRHHKHHGMSKESEKQSGEQTDAPQEQSNR